MKKLIFSIVCVFLSLNSSGKEWISINNQKDQNKATEFAVIEENDNYIILDVHFKGFYLDKSVLPGFSTIETEDGATTLEQGDPRLSQTGALIDITNKKIASYEMLDANWKRFESIKIEPTPIFPKRCDCKAKPLYNYDSKKYEDPAVFPNTNFSLNEIGFLRNTKLARISFIPFRYLTYFNELEAANWIRVKINFEPSTDKITSEKNIENSEIFSEIIRENIINSKDTSKQNRKETMLMIANDSFAKSRKSKIEEFIDWKKEKGLDIQFYKISEVGNTTEKIKKFIQAKYNSLETRPTYVLFVGNEKTIVTNYRNTSSGSAASDYPYSLLSGETNDIIPDVFIGRIVANNIDEMNRNFIKIIKYEKEKDLNNSWYVSGTNIASSEGSNPSDKEYAEQIREIQMKGGVEKIDRFYQGDNTAKPANISAAINEGRSYLTYIGHGSGTSWGSTNGSFSNSNIDALTNGFKNTFIVDVACQNGQYDKKDSFGEHWMNGGLKDTVRGAISYYGGSVNISWHEPAVMARGIAKKHFENKIKNAGPAILAGQMYLMEQMGNGENVIDNFEWYNLFGDPSIELRTSK